MKNLKKLSIIVAIMMFSIGMVSCSKPKTTPVEGTQILLDMVFKDDKSNISKIGMSEADYKEFRDELEKGYVQAFAQDPTGNTISKEDQEKLKNAVFTGLAKIEYEVSEISQDKDTAKVEVKIKGFDLDKIISDGTAKVTAAVFANPSISEAELMKLSTDVVSEGFANGVFIEQPKSLTLDLNLENNMWVPSETGIYNFMAEAVSN